MLLHGIQAAAVEKYPNGRLVQTIYYLTPPKDYTPRPKDGHPPLATVQVATLPLTSVSFIALPDAYADPDASDKQARIDFLKEVNAKDIDGLSQEPSINPRKFLARTIHVIGQEDVVTSIVKSPKAVKLFERVTAIGLRIDLGLVSAFPKGLKLNDPEQRQNQIDDTEKLIVAYKKTRDGIEDFQEAEAHRQALAVLTRKVVSRLLGR